MTQPPRHVRYLRHAEQDVYDAYDYLVRDAPDSALSFLDELDARIRQLARHPELGPRVRDRRLRDLGYRGLLIGHYVAVYKLEDDDIVIYRVLHGHRDWARLL